jgi:hypothetical protein
MSLLSRIKRSRCRRDCSRHWLLLAIVAGLTALDGIRLKAAPLPLGGTVVPDIMTANFSGTPLVQTAFNDFSVPGMSGTLQAIVLRNEATNPFRNDKLTFVYDLYNAAESASALDQLLIASFGAAQTAVTTKQESLGTGYGRPTLADRSTGDAIVFTFFTNGYGPGLIPNRLSARFIIHTDATEFVSTFATVIGGNIATVVTYAPFASVPEPSAQLLGIVGGLLWSAYFARARIRHRGWRAASQRHSGSRN